MPLILTSSATWASRYAVLQLKEMPLWKILIHLQGTLADTNLVSGDGTPVNCHTVMLAGLSPFLRKAMTSSEGDLKLYKLIYRLLKCYETKVTFTLSLIKQLALSSENTNRTLLFICSS